jgi:hypothetical protein
MMAQRQITLTQAAISRAVKGAQAAGFKVGRVEINPRLGTIVIVGHREGEQGESLVIGAETEEGRAPSNDFDE